MLEDHLKNVQDEKETLQTKVDELTRELNDVKGDLSVSIFTETHLDFPNEHSESKLFFAKRKQDS